jgi:uridine kinase
MRIALDGREGSFPVNATASQVVRQLWPEKVSKILALMWGGVALELNQPLSDGMVLTSVTFQHEEGRRIYERSLRFVFLLAARRLFPKVQVRIANSIGYGLFLKLLGRNLTGRQVERLESEMHSIVESDLPFERELWNRDKAIEYFRQDGQDDKVQLLTYRPNYDFPVYRCGGMWEYFYGAMLPSTGWVSVFALRQHHPGLVIQMPGPENPDVPAPYVERPKHLRVFAQSQRWCEILDATNVTDINDMINTGRFREFIRVNEALHDKSIAAIADEIRRRKARLVLISGPSSSGKTTFSNRLKIHLKVLGLRPALLSLDDFYLNRADIPPEPDGSVDLESIHTIDIPLFEDCLKRLLSGGTAEMPRFSFQTGRREETRVPLRVDADEPIVVEGIHGLNPLLTGHLPQDMIFRIYVSALTCVNLDHHNRIRTTDVRLLRRIVRDYQFRGTAPDATLGMWESVRRGEDKWIFPYQEEADVMFNTTLHYELPVLKTVAYDLLKAIPPENPNYLLSRRLLKTLHYLLSMPEDAANEIPPLSILREFIGGCTFYDSHP